jgi:hypothetical protein
VKDGSTEDNEVNEGKECASAIVELWEVDSGNKRRADLIRRYDFLVASLFFLVSFCSRRQLYISSAASFSSRS